MQNNLLSGGVLEQQFNELPSATGYSWQGFIGLEFSRNLRRYAELDRQLTELYETTSVNPQRENIFRAFRECPFADTKVVILGQDPYPNKEHAMGLSFSIPAGEKMPPSLNNILVELENDVGNTQVRDGDLTPWAQQGVLLLNTVLTVEEGKSNSHKKLWGSFANSILLELNEYQKKPLVFILWGTQAHNIGKVMERRAPVGCHRKFIYDVHPSPLSAYRGFFGSKPFSQTNDFLVANGCAPIKW